jgi:hypothetical protein
VVEALMVLYVFAGIYKGDPRFAWMPVDPTGLFLALSVVIGSFIIVFNPISQEVPAGCLRHALPGHLSTRLD